MHSSLGRKLYTETPVYGHHLVEQGKQMMPKRISSRVQLFITTPELEGHIVKAEEEKNPRNIVDWCLGRTVLYEESINKSL